LISIILYHLFLKNGTQALPLFLIHILKKILFLNKLKLHVFVILLLVCKNKIIRLTKGFFSFVNMIGN